MWHIRNDRNGKYRARKTPVTNIEVSPEMIDAAPLESEEAGASAPVAASEAK